MSIRYRFKIEKDFRMLRCRKSHMSVGELKCAIQKIVCNGKTTTSFDLELTKLENKHPYQDDAELVPVNSSVVVVRIPVVGAKTKVWSKYVEPKKKTEEELINEVCGLTRKQNKPDNWNRSKMLPAHYRCHKCRQQGHWIHDCPYNKLNIKRATGIPQSFLKPVSKDTPGAKIAKDGTIRMTRAEQEAYTNLKVDTPISLTEESPSVNSAIGSLKIPRDLECFLCKDLMQHPVKLPACLCVFCDNCATDALIDSEDWQCPKCNTPGNHPSDITSSREFETRLNEWRFPQQFKRFSESNRLASCLQNVSPSKSTKAPPAVISLPDTSKPPPGYPSVSAPMKRRYSQSLADEQDCQNRIHLLKKSRKMMNNRCT